MKAYWNRYLTWFSGLQQRERRIIAAAALIGGLFMGYTYGVEPSLLAARRDARATAEANAAVAQLVMQQAALIQAARQDPDEPLRQQLEALKVEAGKQGEKFVAVERRMVPPEKMTAFLESLLSRGAGLQLVSLRTLSPTPLIERKPVGENKDKPLPAVGAQAEANLAAIEGAPNLFKHGVELKVAGSYQDLAEYVRALENAPQSLIWGQMELVAEYPKSQLTLTLYTLSLEKSWLIL